jgi:hypothetical protein
LKVFYNDIPEIDNIIQEIPMEKIKLLVDKAGEIIENSKKRKNMVFNMDYITHFIVLSTNIILENLKVLKLL